MTLDAGAQHVLNLIKEAKRPAFNTLTPTEAREVSASTPPRCLRVISIKQRSVSVQLRRVGLLPTGSLFHSLQKDSTHRSQNQIRATPVVTLAAAAFQQPFAGTSFVKRHGPSTRSSALACLRRAMTFPMVAPASTSHRARSLVRRSRSLRTHDCLRRSVGFTSPTRN